MEALTCDFLFSFATARVSWSKTAEGKTLQVRTATCTFITGCRKKWLLLAREYANAQPVGKLQVATSFPLLDQHWWKRSCFFSIDGSLMGVCHATYCHIVAWPFTLLLQFSSSGKAQGSTQDPSQNSAWNSWSACSAHAAKSWIQCHEKLSVSSKSLLFCELSVVENLTTHVSKGILFYGTIGLRILPQQVVVAAFGIRPSRLVKPV